MDLKGRHLLKLLDFTPEEIISFGFGCFLQGEEEEGNPS